MTAKPGDLITPTGVLVMDIETMRGDREAWLEARKSRPGVPGGFCIGSSEVPSVLDLDGVDTPAHVFRSKTMKIRREPTEAMIWGTLLEETIALEWQRRNQVVTDEIGLLAHVDKPWHVSTVDRRVRECPLAAGGAGVCIAEIKTVGYASASRWHADLPDRILAQIVHQLFVSGVGHAHYACLIGGNMMRQGVVYAEREAELMAYIVAEVDRFRTDHLLTGIEPDWDTSRKAAKLIALDTATHPIRAGELTVDEIGDVMAYAQAAAEESAAKKRKERYAARLRQLADGAEMVLFADRPAYRYSPSPRTNVNLDALRERHPDAYADPAVVSEKTSYTLRIDRSYQVRIKEDS